MTKLKVSYWQKAGFFTLMERFSVQAFGLITFFVLIRVLPKENFGIWTLFYSLTSIADLIRNGFLRNPLIKFVNEDEGRNEYKTILSSSFFLNVILSGLLAIILIFCAQPLSVAWSSPDLIQLFYIYTGTIFFMVFFTHFEVVQHANLSFAGVTVSYLIQKAVFLIFILAVTYFQGTISLNFLAIGQAISVMLSCIVSYFYSRKMLYFSFRIDKAWFSKLFNYGKYTFGTNISSMLMRNIDSWMIGYFMSPAAVAIYNPAIRVSNLLELPTSSLASILFPQAAKKIRKEGKEAVKRLYEKSVAVILAFMLPCVMIIVFFAKEVILLIAGPEYLESVPALQVTMLYGIILPFNRQLGVILDAAGKASTNMLFVMRNAIINLLMNILLIPLFGVLGAAFATLLTYLISMVINQIYLKRNYDINFFSYLNNVAFYYKECWKFIVKFQQRLTK